ncbi:MAG: reverse transcriptase domain-containing protein, partial [Acidimicrobiales bacterium]|nr:reverse transcriptase domain-containing protein [Acidimicrobiales bacterium]
MDDPKTIAEAMSRPDSKLWTDAIQNELKSFEENNAWELVDTPKDCSIVDCKWVFKRKVDSANNVQYRARLVARGFTQQCGIDYDETFSPVVRHSTLRFLVALSCKFDLNITHLDVATAFLNGHLKEKVFMKQPQDYKTVKCNKVLKLNRAIYGLKQSSRVWYSLVETVLIELGYKKSAYEPCMFFKSENGSLTIIALYVDDFFIFSNNSVETSNLKTKLSSEFKIKDLGEAKQCLGVRFSFDKEKGIVTLDQKQYIEQLLVKFNMTDCKPATTPMES